MISQINLNKFKCFGSLHLPLGQLTLLTGLNASGKSTVLQSLVLLNQTMVDFQWSKELHLDGLKLSLGTVTDVVDKVAGRTEFGIGLAWKDTSCFWVMESNDRSSMTMPVKSVQWHKGAERTRVFNEEKDFDLHFLMPQSLLTESAEAKDLATAVRDLSYLSAERCGPRETYRLSAAKFGMSTAHMGKSLSETSGREVGHTGEGVAAILHQFSDEILSSSELIRPDVAPTLFHQTQAWMDQFFPGFGMDVQLVPNASLVTMAFRTSLASGFQRPQNVGFGLTHILPIVVACLIAVPGDVLLVENPEVHLHPAGQALMGKFLATVAKSGIQIIMETHSDHVLNGVRRAVHDQLLHPEQVRIHFFTPRTPEQERAQVFTPTINSGGALDSWPEGFFDQFDKDISFLTGW